MLYIYAGRNSAVQTLKDIENTKLIKFVNRKWIEDNEIQENDKILFIAGNVLISPIHKDKIIGSVDAIRLAKHKVRAREFFQKNGISVPKTWFDYDEAVMPFIARPRFHSMNSSFYIIRNYKDKRIFSRKLDYNPKHWYFSEVIDVDKEYRVMILDGEVFLVYNRMLGEDLEDTLSVRDAARRDNALVRYEASAEVSQENIQLCVDAMNLLGLGYGAVDLIVDKNGKGYIVEVNTTPSLSGELVKEALRAAVIKLAAKLA